VVKTLTVLRHDSEHHHNTHTQPFYGSVDFVRDNPGEPVPEETFTHSHSSWSSIIPINASQSHQSTVFVLHSMELDGFDFFHNTALIVFLLLETSRLGLGLETPSVGVEAVCLGVEEAGVDDKSGDGSSVSGGCGIVVVVV